MYLDTLRCVSIVGVVLLHSAMPLLGSADMTELLPGLVYSALCMFCVPTLIMISGALILGDPRPLRLGKFFGKRFAKIAWPLVLWSAVYYLAYCLAEPSAPNLISFGKRLLTGLWAGPLWFLYMIAGVYLMVPFIKPAFSDPRTPLGPLFIGITFAIMTLNLATRLLWQHELNTFLTSAVLPHYLGYFVLGHVLHQRTVRVPGGRVTLVLAFLLCTGVNALGEYACDHSPDMLPNSFFNYHQPFSMLAAVAAFLLFKQDGCAGLGFASKTIQTVSRLSFGIFLAHTLILFLVTGQLPLLVQPGQGLIVSGMNPWVGPPLTALVVFTLSALLTWGLQRTPWLRRAVP
ncbi:acyltransferase [Fundidesulfovibrio agrisoli]|uniref:acyltransferase n=1 Tax=Fundidesulfovibrio agrisoli TaxID=2922717 RepID=UPI001FAE044A|nr:acyltransferase [Fundidesulfovibrio agrisoli]